MKGRCNTSGENVKAEVEYQAPVIAQIAENLGVTITTPSGTSKQVLQGNNANLLNIKNNAKKEGAYVWKKYGRTYDLTPIATKQSVIISASTTTTVYYSDSYSVDDESNVVLENPQSISWEATSYPSASLKQQVADAIFGKYVIVGEYDSSNENYKVISATSGKNVFIAQNPTSTSGNVLYIVSNAATIYTGEVTDTFEANVVSDSPTAYPDGGEQGGYWYELFDLKSFGIDFGEITLASASETVTVNHALGAAPSFVALIPKILDSESSANLINVNGKTIRKSSSSWYINAVTNTLTDTSIEFGTYSSSFKYPAKDYYWIAIA